MDIITNLAIDGMIQSKQIAESKMQNTMSGMKR